MDAIEQLSSYVLEIKMDGRSQRKTAYGKDGWDLNKEIKMWICWRESRARE